MSMNDVFVEIGKLKVKTLQPQAVMLHPRALGRVKTAFDKDEKPVSSPFGIRIHTADWLDPEEYYLGNAETIQAVLTIAEEYGPEIAKVVLEKIIEISGCAKNSETPSDLQKTT